MMLAILDFIGAEANTGWLEEAKTGSRGEKCDGCYCSRLSLILGSTTIF